MRWVWLTLSVLAACEAGPSVQPRSVVSPHVDITGFTQVVPSSGLPAEAAPNAANNNLDVATFQGRIFLAFRTADTHFAGPEVRMVVVSTEDEITWRYEGEVALGTDVREPQLVEIGGVLHLYFTRLGDSPLAFAPGGMSVVRYLAPGEWTEPEEVFDEGFLAWRMKWMDGRLNVLGYTNGAGIYTVDGDPIVIHWRVTDDGVHLRPAFGEQDAVLSGGGSETDLVHLPDGRYVAVVRNEAGDETGFGSKICVAQAEAPMEWDCLADRRKFDSPLLLQAAGRVWLVARRNVTEDGFFDLGRTDLSFEGQYTTYQLAYWQEPKRCAVWVVEPDLRTVTWIADLPSAGDTCFPEALETDGGLVLYNYSTDPDRGDISWIEGQTSPTGIYRQVLTFR